MPVSMSSWRVKPSILSGTSTIRSPSANSSMPWASVTATIFSPVSGKSEQLLGVLDLVGVVEGN